ncbi:hypothetical protein [Arenibacter sp. H213]|uniref:Uncharacterized protein n=1 Tax=Arenibacter antarcticus TaxID=2040469 RepID=A0ABW5VHZ9_9FLAO|nr:hypothetical protein [Arenibacter sp. H213]
MKRWPRLGVIGRRDCHGSGQPSKRSGLQSQLYTAANFNSAGSINTNNVGLWSEAIIISPNT